MKIKLSIAVVDDHAVVLHGVKEFLEQDSNLDVVATFTTPSSLMEYVKDRPVDIVVTDYSMPSDDIYGDGLRYVAYLIRNFPETRVLVFTTVSNPMIISALYDAGVTGVLLKEEPLSQLTAAIQCVRLNTRYYSLCLQKDGMHRKQPVFLRDRIGNLSPREFEVLRHFAKGESITQIAERLRRSVKTVSLQKNSAMRKLNVDSNQELIAFCGEHHLFD
ncbi:Capsular synthesis regulator component B [Delftia tsuruhatensis]|uniref:response regulator transcription factor n=1 Tax=Delftia tsuruhatensis TaxID=180282 RepID=UPI001E7C1356|nr:response regulator transcription factor [Delftia tsuruhatensis]CAB5703613.1 Capsular synthesis regulator component B [Delftia tsuruhatensis]CAC9684382.1 Capsular synthesis regulator component B [Delftia tsuruhatensis]